MGEVKNHFIGFFCQFVFGSILSPWALWPLIPEHPGSASHGLTLMAWLLSWTSHWLATHTSSNLDVPQQKNG